MSSASNGHKAQNIFLSTRKTATGTMQKLITECKERGFKLYSFCILEVVEKCRLKVDCQECFLYEKGCEGQARKSNGFFPIAEMKRKARNMDSNTFQAQWLCRKPVSSGNFFEFDRRYHVISIKDFCSKYGLDYQDGVKPTSIIPISWQRFASIDWGFSDPLAILAFTYDPANDIIYVYNETYEKALSVTDILNLWCGANKRINGKYLFDHSGFNWQNETFSWIVADNNRPDLRLELNRLRKGKVLITPIKNKEKALEYSYTKVRERLMIDENSKTGLVFFENCENAIREFDSLLCGANGLPSKGQDDHTVDAVRYFIARLATIEHLNRVSKRQDEAIKRLMA